MRILLQRVTSASVTVDGSIVGQINHGLVLLTGISPTDTQPIADRMAEKIVNLRIFNDEAGKFNRSLLDVAGEALVVSQFTLFADARKGRRPSFTEAARPELASPLCDHFAARLRTLGVKHVATGVFGADMHVNIQNSGPVTIWLDSAELPVP
ncbi:MAG: D-aminoacyl-tRNA deacylase [Phycisphaeraceae bacterium]